MVYICKTDLVCFTFKAPRLDDLTRDSQRSTVSESSSFVPLTQLTPSSPVSTVSSELSLFDMEQATDLLDQDQVRIELN